MSWIRGKFTSVLEDSLYHLGFQRQDTNEILVLEENDLIRTIYDADTRFAIINSEDKLHLVRYNMTVDCPLGKLDFIIANPAYIGCQPDTEYAARSLTDLLLNRFSRWTPELWIED